MRAARQGLIAKCVAAALAMCIAAPALLAADAADPERVEERLPTEQPKPDVAAPGPVRVDEEDLSSIPQFDLSAVAIEGMTVIDRKDADVCTRDLTGKQVGAASLVGLTSCLTKLYRDRDYFLSRAVIPAQEVRDGVLTVRVFEGYIAAIQPDGLDQSDADAQFAQSLTERPTTLATFERNLLLLADRYGRRVIGTRLAADKADPARFTLKLEVTLTPVTWRVFGDNRGDAYQGPEQGLLSVALNAPFGANDRIIAQLFTAPADKEALFFADMGYGRAWNGGAFWTEVGASTSRSSSGDAFPLFVSESNRVYGRLIVPVLRSREHSLWAKLQADARETETLDIAAPDVRETTRILRGSFAYALVAGSTRAEMTLEASHGFDAFDASKNGDANLSRPDGRPQFTKAKLDASIMYNLFAKLDLAATGSAQWSDGALVSSEEFGAGGARFGRAYDYSEIVGDDGLAGAIELRWSWRALNEWLTSLQVFAFADAARVWNEGTASESLTSAGAGFRIGVAPGISAAFEVAKPLSHDVVSQGDRDARVFVSLSAGW